MNNNSKSSSLKFIRNKISKNLVPIFFSFYKKDYLKDKNKIITEIQRNYKESIILRSSAVDEDGKIKSNAGKYDSLIVKKKEFYELQKKIEFILKKLKNNLDEIIVQKLIVKPEISGVVFTKDKNTDSHYYDINFDVSKKTDLVTSGKYNPSIKKCDIACARPAGQFL